MKASVLHEYGGPSKLRYEDRDEPQPGADEVRVRVLATSINPVDWKMRSGEARERFPLNFPAVLGRDLAGIVDCVGSDVKGFAEGDKVFALAHETYAELCLVKSTELARVPDGLEMTVASTVPLVSLTGDQLIRKGTEAQKDQTVLLTGALGSVGRCALFCLQEIGAKVIAGVRKKQIEEALQLGAVVAINLDDPHDIARVGMLDAVADTVGGKLAAQLLGKVKPGGFFGSVLGPPADAALHPLVQVRPVMSEPKPDTLRHYAEAVRDGRLKLPLEAVMPLAAAGEAQARAEKGGIGKIVLVP